MGPTPLSPPPLALGTLLYQQHKHEMTDGCKAQDHRGQASFMQLPLPRPVSQTMLLLSAAYTMTFEQSRWLIHSAVQHRSPMSTR